jgi:hypothetical protein
MGHCIRKHFGRQSLWERGGESKSERACESKSEQACESKSEQACESKSERACERRASESKIKSLVGSLLLCITAVPYLLQRCSRAGRGIVEDMC